MFPSFIPLGSFIPFYGPIRGLNRFQLFICQNIGSFDTFFYSRRIWKERLICFVFLLPTSSLNFHQMLRQATSCLLDLFSCRINRHWPGHICNISQVLIFPITQFDFAMFFFHNHNSGGIGVQAGGGDGP